MTRVLILAALLAASCAGGTAYPEPFAGPHVIQLVWTDGATDYPGWCAGHVPAAFAGDRQVYLDGLRSWLAPFDATVTDEPVSDPLLTVVLSSGFGEDCGMPPGRLGQASIYGPHTVANIWQAGLGEPGQDVTVVAHEVGHALGGLDHVDDVADVMNTWVPGGLTGYEDRDIRSRDATGWQNAYQWMLQNLGPRKLVDNGIH